MSGTVAVSGTIGTRLITSSGPIRWRIYYGDRTTYGSQDGSPFDAPSTNVQVVIKETPRSKVRPWVPLFGHDHYMWSTDPGVTWSACDWAGLFDYLMTYKGPKAVLFGRTLRDESFWELLKWAKSEGLG